jgi:ATP-dependent DNA ligase
MRSNLTASACRRALKRAVAKLLTRTGLDWSDKYPNVVAALAKLRVKIAYLDGELCGVAMTDAELFTNPGRERWLARVRLVYYAFDLLHLEGQDIASLPHIERKALLKPLIAGIPGRRRRAYPQACVRTRVRRRRLQNGRCTLRAWKQGPLAQIQVHQRQEFVVVGWTDPEGIAPSPRRSIAHTDDGKLIYAGRVGTGMPDEVLADLRRRLDPLARARRSLRRRLAKPASHRRSFSPAYIGLSRSSLPKLPI